MKINIGSKNQIKVEALTETIKDYKLLSHSTIHSINSSSMVAEQPKSLDEIIFGAKNRAKGAFNDCDLSFGIESGLMSVGNTKTGYMDICACAIYDGKQYHIGLSCAFEFPSKVIKTIFEEGIDANEAFYKINLTDNRKIGSAEGAIGILTRGRVTRKDYTKQAIQMALIHLENPNLYST